MRKLNVLKERGWVEVSGPVAPTIRTAQGQLYRATEMAPEETTLELASKQSHANQSHETVSLVSGDVCKAAREQLERLKRGKSSAA